MLNETKAVYHSDRCINLKINFENVEKETKIYHKLVMQKNEQV